MDLIIGAGITGLSYANFCGHDNYHILEKDKQPGGYCKTIKKEGFTWDYSGHFFHFRTEEIKNYLVSRMKDKEILTVTKQAQIKYKDRYIDFPFQKNIHQLSKEEMIDCLFDLFNKKEMDEYGSFIEMLYGKFGKSISEKFLIPYNEKLYACNLDDLDVNAMGRFFPYAEKEEIILNFKQNQLNYYNDSFTYPRDGAMEYVNALLMDLDSSKIALEEKVIRIDLKNKKVISNKNIYSYERLISTIPFPTLLDLCAIEYDKKIYTCNKVLVFNLGFDKKGKDTVNHWVYFPEKKYCFYRVGYYDNILSDNRMSLYVEIGFNVDEKVDIEQTKNKVISDLRAAGIIIDHELISYHHVIMDPAYVHIKEDSFHDKNNKKEILRDNNIYSIGRYGDWKYCSIEDNIIEAKTLANGIN